MMTTHPSKPQRDDQGFFYANVYHQAFPKALPQKGRAKENETEWEANLVFKKTVKGKTTEEVWKKAKSEFVAPVLEFA
jgi:hypothetical protein